MNPDPDDLVPFGPCCSHHLTRRAPIEQAKGQIMLTERVGADEAFDIIRRHARSTSRPVHGIAVDIIDGRLRPWTLTEAVG